MTIDTAGNVGIGSNDPYEKLEVNGNIKLLGSTRQLLVGSSDVNSFLRFDSGNSFPYFEPGIPGSRKRDGLDCCPKL